MKARSWLGAARKVSLALAATGVLAMTAGVSTAGAATTSNLQYSTDGGTTWTTSATVAPGQTVQVRQWYSNDGTQSETNASLSTSLPTGFSLVGGSTQVCLNPSTTNIGSPNLSELDCASSNEASVWSGSSLQVSPSAGHNGESNGSTVGDLATGRKRYLNLQLCSYAFGSNSWYNNVVPTAFPNSDRDAYTTVSNAAGTALNCSGTGGSTVAASSSGFLALDLLGKKYLNLHQCSYRESGGGGGWYSSWTPTAFGGTDFDAGTNTSNTADSSLSCGDVSGSYTYQPLSSGLQALDLTSGRYLNLHQCAYTQNGGSTYTSINPTPFGGTLFDSGTNVSDTPDTALDCGAPASGYQRLPDQSGFQAFDLLDTTRSAGYVAYSITAPAAPTAAACAAGLGATEDFAQTGDLTSAPSGTQSSNGTLTVDWSTLSDPCGSTGTPMADPRVAAAAVITMAGAGWMVHRRRTVAA